MIDKILIEMNNIERATGRKASSIYLGGLDFNRLRDEVDVYGFFAWRDSVGRYQVCGLDIFIVDGDTHFHVD